MSPKNNKKKNINNSNDKIDYRNELIIDTPDLQTLKQRYSFSLLTFIFWVFWFYLWNPLVSLLAWSFGFEVFYENMINLGGWPGLIEKLNSYVLAILAMGIVFFGWAFYNNFRFYNKKRRGKLWKVNTMNLSDQFSITRDEVLRCKSAKRIVINFDPGGNITHLSNDSLTKKDPDTETQ